MSSFGLKAANVTTKPQPIWRFSNKTTQGQFRSYKRKSIFTMAERESKTVLVPIATSSEEMEAVITIDVLRRAGATVTVASVEDTLQVTMSRNVKLVADKLITDCQDETYDLIALPGGMPGAERLRDSTVLMKMFKKQQESDRLHAAICATPAVALEHHGLLKNKLATAHPGFVSKLSNQSAAEQRVVVDGMLTTSRGPGTSFEFALSLVKQLYGEKKMQEVAGPMVMYNGYDENIA